MLIRANMGKCRVLLILSILIGSPHAVSGQVISSHVPTGQVEIGYYVQSIRRTIQWEDGPVQDMDWGRAALFVKLGVSNAVAVDLEGSAWHEGSSDRFPDRDYYRLTFGVGVNTTIWRRKQIQFSLDLHLHEMIYLDQSASGYDKRSEQLSLAPVVDFNSMVMHQRVNIWAAPIWLVDRVHEYPKYRAVGTGTSVDDFGAVIGASLLVSDRFRLFAQWTYANFWQGQGGISLVI